jgi:hypothetical protein
MDSEIPGSLKSLYFERKVKIMAIIKKTVKAVSTLIGEALVVGGALGTAYVLGFIKGSDAKPIVEDVANKVGDAIAKTTTKTEEPATEQEAESTEGETAPPIEVSSNQPED